ncbi:hypothetical protein H072_10683 [Dactylellina haptotyla CBS 200.50]|uniref:Carboxylic ester hydrolase n=1 Tax=Dactylellina haptotyla (strain CBS 200.50) TaxID=1284197 RepID=S7ZYR2_DACHA|nr:hypothetical protein H072_10683 [Dactylellina haptotyla CBS 200.50]
MRYSYLSHIVSSLTLSLLTDIGVEASPYGPPSTTPKVDIKNGTVTGRYSREWNQDFFLGVPFAEPPTGQFRFRPPQYIRRKRNFDAREFGPRCIDTRGDPYGMGPNSSEDCLTLNIVRPSGIDYTKRRNKLPVGLFIHGGGFQSGTGSNERYNMTFMVHQSVELGTPIIGVTINYRLGGLGFLSSRQMSRTKNDNLGFRDQRIALHWLQENIAAFGGDPKRVTLFGQSAGAYSIGWHMMAYGGRDDGLFSGAIMQSGGPIWVRPFAFPDTFQDRYYYVLNATGCLDALDSLDCLRSVPLEILQPVFATPQGFCQDLVIDGDMLRGYPSVEFSEGRYLRIPSIIGTTSDEFTSYARIFTPQTNEQSLRDYLKASGQYSLGTIDRLLQVYPLSVGLPPQNNISQPDQGVVLHGPQFHRISAIMTDLDFNHGKRFIARRLVADKVPVWTYRSRARQNNVPDWIGAPHFAEIAFVFNNRYAPGDLIDTNIDHIPNPLGGYNESENLKLADFMSKSWVRFVATGDPASGRSRSEVNWEKYKNGNGKSQIVFDIGVGGTYIEQDDYREEQYNFWKGLLEQNSQ